MTDLDILIEKFLVPMKIENVCDELYDHGYDPETTETWCSRNCGVVNDGTCPSKECYLEYIRMVKGGVKNE